MRILQNIPFFLLAALLIFAPLARGGVHGWAIGIIFLTVLTAAALYLAANIWQGNLRWIKTPLDYPILALVCLTLLSFIFSVHRPTSILASLQLFSCIAVYYLTIHTVNSRSRIRQLLYLVFGISLFLALFGMFKSAGLNPFPWWEYQHQTNAAYLSATYGNRNHLAGWMEMSIALVLGFIIFKEKGRTKIISLALVLLLLAALVFSQSRGGWFGMLVAFMFMSFLLYRSKKVITSRWAIIIVNAVFVVGFITVSSTPVTDRVLTAEAGFEDGSLAGRITAWNGVVELAKANPLLGTGPGTFAVTFPKYQPAGFQANLIYAHNDYLDFTAELGFGLLVIVAWMVVALYRHGLTKMGSKSTLTRGITLGALAGITAILVHSFVDFNLHIPANALLFTVLAALAASPKRVKQH